jgi:hypothetical protein
MAGSGIRSRSAALGGRSLHLEGVAAALAEELKEAADRGEPDDGSRYYEHWLAALERLVTRKGLTDTAALTVRKQAWADAYRHTPHGHPVVLRKTDS